MKVAIFIDGKNFHAGYRQLDLDRRVDFPSMASWLVEQVGGSFLWGVSYYTGIETGDGAGTEEQAGLRRFLDTIEVLPGFFVKRFPRKIAVSRCPSCQELNRYSKEKEVDTTMVADMLRLAAVGAFDILILVSGDADHAPAVEGVRSLGKQAYVATWGGHGLSARARRAAFDHIDLCTGIPVFTPEVEASSVRPEHQEENNQDRLPETSLYEESELSASEEFIDELRRAEYELRNGYVGVNYFVTRWKARRLSSSADIRRRILDRLVDEGRVEVFSAGDGSRALRVRRGTDA